MIPDCRWSRPRIIAYLDGELDDQDESQVNEHLSACQACRSVAEAERAMTARVRAVAGAERAPARLADRIRKSLAEVGDAPGGQSEDASAPAAATPPTQGTGRAPAVKQAVARRFFSLQTASAVAAALLLAVGLAIFWPASHSNLLQAMAKEHHEHTESNQPEMLELVSTDEVAMESYLSNKMGLSVRLPKIDFAMKHGVTFCKCEKRDFGLVACFCRKRSHAVSLFVVRADGVPLKGLESFDHGGRIFWRGSVDKCRTVMWKSGDLYYALVGEFKDPADQLDLAKRTADAMEVCPISK